MHVHYGARKCRQRRANRLLPPLRFGLFTEHSCKIKLFRLRVYLLTFQISSYWFNLVGLSLWFRQNDGPAASATELLDLETSHQIVEAYIWLSYRFPGRFPDRELAVAECEEAVELISESLRDVTFSRHSPWEEDEEDRPPMAPEQRRNQRIRSGANNRSKGRYVVDYSRSKKGAFRRTSIA